MWPRGYAQVSTSGGPKFESYERNDFVYSLCLSFWVCVVFVVFLFLLFVVVFIFFAFLFGSSMFVCLLKFYLWSQ